MCYGNVIFDCLRTMSVTSIPRGFEVKNPMPRFLPGFFVNSMSSVSTSGGSARYIVNFTFKLMEIIVKF